MLDLLSLCLNQKKNTIDPQNIINEYGADAVRFFILSDSPPEKDLEWTDTGVHGAWKFINKLWKLVTSNLSCIPQNLSNEPKDLDENSLKLRKKSHKAIKNITECLEDFRFNVAVAKIHELVNDLQNYLGHKDISGWVKRESIEIIIRLSNPMLPHITEELWQKLGNESLLCKEPWPSPIASLYQEESVNISIQINGKHKVNLNISGGKNQDKQEESQRTEQRLSRNQTGKRTEEEVVEVVA